MEHLKKNFYSIATLLCGITVFIFNGGATFGDIKKDVATIKATTGQLGSDVSGLKKDVTDIKVDQGAMSTDIKNLKQEFSDWKADNRASQPRAEWRTTIRDASGTRFAK